MRGSLALFTLAAVVAFAGCYRDAKNPTKMEVASEITFPDENTVVRFSLCDPPSVELTGDAAAYVRTLGTAMLKRGLRPEPKKEGVAAEWPWGCFSLGNLKIYAYENKLHGRLTGSPGFASSMPTPAITRLKDILRREKGRASESVGQDNLSKDVLRRVIDRWRPQEIDQSSTLEGVD